MVDARGDTGSGDVDTTTAAATATTSTTSTTTDVDSTGETPTQRCGLEDLAPGAPNPIVAGTEAEQIPPDIAVILADNCGCHYANDLLPAPPYLDYAEGTMPLDLATWAGFQATNPNDQPYHAVALDRVMGGGAIPMPPDPGCERIPTADYDTLVAWLTAGAPDGATWMNELQACGIEDIKPGAPNPIVSGTDAGLIPPDIGTLLAENCGCHLVDDPTAEGIVDYEGTIEISTLAGFNAPYSGGGLVHQQAYAYVMTKFMPLQLSCDIGDGEAMLLEDRAVLEAWLSQGAPDGATWVPPA